MSTLSKWSAVFLVCLPAAAFANPTEVFMHSSGVMTPYNPMLAVLGLNAVPTNANYPFGNQPFSLTIGAIMDPRASSVISDPQVPYFEQFNTQIEISFQFGTQHYQYSGVGDVLIQGGYDERVTVHVPGSDTRIFAETLTGGGGPLLYAPPDVDGGGGSSAIYAVSGPFDDPTFIGMSRLVDDGISIRTISLVPEPAGAPMLGAGLLVLLAPSLQRWRARKCEKQALAIAASASS